MSLEINLNTNNPEVNIDSINANTNIETDNNNVEINLKTSSGVLKNINANQPNIKIGTPQINGINDYVPLKNKPKINGVELIGDLSSEDLNIQADNNYENASNKPSINGVELIGNKTTEDLGIETTGGVKGVEVNNANVVDENGVAKISVAKKISQLENDSGYLNRLSTNLEYYYTKTETDKKINALPLGTVINIEDKFYFGKKFENNDVYNANAVNSSVDWTVQALLGALQAEYFVSINVVVNPLNYDVISIDGDYGDIEMAHDIEGSVRCVCQLAQTNINVVLNLALIDDNYAYFTNTMKVNLGAGETKYLFGLYVYSNSNRTPKVVIDILQ